MRGNYYGVDIKITSEGKPYLIEINGWNAGTKGFIDGYGDLRTQEKILEAMVQYSNGKPIYSRSGEISTKTAGFIGILAALALFSLPCTLPLAKLFETVGMRSVPIVHEHYHVYLNALKDLHWIVFKSCAVDNHFDQAAKKIGIDFVRFRESYHHYTGDIIIQVAPTDWRTLGNDGGYYWSVGSHRSPKYNDFVANPYVVRNILDSKWYVHKLLQETWLKDHLPQTLLDGNANNYPEQLESLRHKVIIQKPHHLSLGEGIKIFDKNTLPSLWYSQRLMTDMKLLSESIDPELIPKTHWINQLRGYINFHHLWNNLTVLQEYVPSQPIHSRKTDGLHDSCIRAIVFDGTFIDAYHRLAPRPINGKIDEKTGIANLSRGALAEPLADEEKEIVSKFAEQTIATLENRIEALHLNDKHDWDSYKYNFWKEELAQISP